MKALFFSGGRMELREVPKPKFRRGWAVVRVLAAGVCNTDIELLKGYYQFRGVPGHEFVGEVVAADSKQLVGQRVVGEINISCGRCAWCKQDLGRHCPRRSVLGIVKHPGAFAEYVSLPERNLHLVPEEISNEEAVFTEPLAAALEILEQITPPLDERIAVLGDGKLGLIIAQALKLRGYEVDLFGRHRKKMELVRSIGVRTQVVGENLPKSRYRTVIEATGAADGLNRALQMVCPRGTIVLKSTIHEKILIDSAEVVVNEITLVGSRCGRFEPALELLRGGKLVLKEMIHGVFPLQEADRAFEFAQQPGVLKVLLVPGGFG